MDLLILFLFDSLFAFVFLVIDFFLVNSFFFLVDWVIFYESCLLFCNKEGTEMILPEPAEYLRGYLNEVKSL